MNMFLNTFFTVWTFIILVFIGLAGFDIYQKWDPVRVITQEVVVENKEVVVNTQEVVVETQEVVVENKSCDLSETNNRLDIIFDILSGMQPEKG